MGAEGLGFIRQPLGSRISYRLGVLRVWGQTCLAWPPRILEAPLVLSPHLSKSTCPLRPSSSPSCSFRKPPFHVSEHWLSKPGTDRVLPRGLGWHFPLTATCATRG